MVEIPVIKKHKWYNSDWLLEVLCLLPAIPLAYGAWDQFNKGNKAWAIAFVVGLLLLLVVGLKKVQRAKSKEEIEKPADGPKDLLACTLPLLHVLRQLAGLADNNTDVLRITFHKIIFSKAKSEHGESYEQVIEYVGGGGGEPGRRFMVQCGIVGRVARENEMLKAKRNSEKDEEFVKELVSIWGYTQKQARQLTLNRRSYMAVPIKDRDGDAAVGVLYLDSSDPDFFDDEVRVEVIVKSCFGLAEYIKRRYT